MVRQEAKTQIFDYKIKFHTDFNVPSRQKTKHMDFIDIIGLFAGTCVTISTIPQIFKVWKTKKVKDISLKTFSILTFGILVWVIYGILKNDLPIIITNSVSLCLNMLMVYFIIYYEKEN